ncbi:hypothetical protein QQF64_031335 [Cirrhinus molitorella]|uniref:DUF5641 domain-containing protein n=1 Tax=Cirrhinus molitorella TaxID=172907 RepID=A0ABR3MWS8_9TELE
MLSRRHLRHSQLLAEHFWKHFLRYYLPDLQARHECKTEKKTLEIGNVVLIVDPQLPCALWPVGRVIQVFPGPDSRVQTASVDVKGRTYTRVVARLIQFPALPEPASQSGRPPPLRGSWELMAEQCVTLVTERWGCQDSVSPAVVLLFLLLIPEGPLS